MTAPPELFARCVLPGCTRPADEQGHPCPDCARAFTGYLHPAAAPPLTEAEQHDRDEHIRAAQRGPPHRRRRSGGRRRHRRGVDQAEPTVLALRRTPHLHPHQRAMGMPTVPERHLSCAPDHHPTTSTKETRSR
ncbi:hypothetical protein [Williamsia limnetica]|uniref:hypothetical protein n=1 Tax=Williamsia limnetica TaxID=882452 RepID=UPI00131419EA|nr:hypothetical protein [Williamsia limnetica]